jgi:hypothetical protein
VADPKKMHDGESLHRKWVQCKRTINNVISPEWSKALVGGSLPSGKTVEDVLLVVREALWNKEEQEKVLKASPSRPYAVLPWSPECEEPLEWLPFILMGPPSAKPDPHFDLVRSCGPPADGTMSNRDRKRKAKKAAAEAKKVRKLAEIDVKRLSKTREEKESSKERKLLRKQNASYNLSLLLEQRKTRSAELKELYELTDSPTAKAAAKQEYIKHLTSEMPKMQAYEDSSDEDMQNNCSVPVLTTPGACNLTAILSTPSSNMLASSSAFDSSCSSSTSDSEGSDDSLSN